MWNTTTHITGRTSRGQTERIRKNIKEIMAKTFPYKTHYSIHTKALEIQINKM